MFHTPAMRAISPETVGSPTVSRRCYWNEPDLNYAPTFLCLDFFGKIIFSSGTGHFMCPSFSVSRASQQVHRRTRRGETGRPVRSILSTINSKKKLEKHETFARRHSM
jgi:hypothetical protein